MGKHYEEERMAAFVVLLSDEPQKYEEELVAVARDSKLTHTPLTTYKKASGPRKYQIHENADVTVMMWVDSEVKSNHAFASGELDEKGIQKVIADTATILN